MKNSQKEQVVVVRFWLLLILGHGRRGIKTNISAVGAQKQELCMSVDYLNINKFLKSVAIL